MRKPGTFRFEDKMTIVQAVTLAGGLKALAAKDRLILTRVVDGDEKKFVVPFKRISEGRVSNVFLQPGDIVFVPRELALVNSNPERAHLIGSQTDFIYVSTAECFAK